MRRQGRLHGRRRLRRPASVGAAPRTGPWTHAADCHAVACAPIRRRAHLLDRPKDDGARARRKTAPRHQRDLPGRRRSGVARDGFFFPVPDSCHVGQCSPGTGLCEAVPGNDGTPCSDSEICHGRQGLRERPCEGGVSRDCSALDVGCSTGACDPAPAIVMLSRSLPAAPASRGRTSAIVAPATRAAPASSIHTGARPSETAGCTVGVCSEAGVCTPRSVPDGGACVDSDWCTLGETCLAGLCQGGRPATSVSRVFQRDVRDRRGRLGARAPTWPIGPRELFRAKIYSNFVLTRGPDHGPTADNGLAGVTSRGNAPLVVHPYYYLTSPVVDTGVWGGVYLTFWRFLNSDEAPR